jgi:hypothetical protein
MKKSSSSNFRTILSTSRVPPLIAGGISANLRTRENSARTFSLANGEPLRTMGIRPSSGMLPKGILHPAQPALRANKLSGGRFSILLAEKKALGINSTFSTNQRVE